MLLARNVAHLEIGENGLFCRDASTTTTSGPKIAFTLLPTELNSAAIAKGVGVGCDGNSTHG